MGIIKMRLLEWLLILQQIPYAQFQEQMFNCTIHDPLYSPYKYHKAGHYMIGGTTFQTVVFFDALSFEQYPLPNVDSPT